MGNGYLSILSTSVFSKSISIPEQLQTSIRLSIMPCSIVSSLVSSASHLHISLCQLLILLLRCLQNPWRPSLVSYSLYNLNRIVDKNQPFIPPPSIFTLLDYSWSSRNLTFWSTYDLLISFISRQSTVVPFRICTNLIHFTQSNAFCQSMKHTCTVLRLCPKFVLILFSGSQLHP